MPYNPTTGILNFVPEKPAAFVARAMFEGRFMSMLKSGSTIVTGIKTTGKVTGIEGNVTFQSGAGCGWNESGDTAVVDRTITVGDIKVQEQYCPKDLISKAAQYALKTGSREFEEMAFGEEILNLKVGRIAEANEIAVWQGDTVSGNPNLNKFDGLVKQIDAATDEILANSTTFGLAAAITTATGITTANVESIIDAVVMAIPTTVLNKKDLAVYCGWDTFRKAGIAYKLKNYFNFMTSMDAGEMIIPNTNIKLIAVEGLGSGTGANRLFAFSLSNIALGTDMEGEEEDAFVEYDKSTQQNRVACYFKLGVLPIYTSEIVSFKLV